MLQRQTTLPRVLHLICWIPFVATPVSAVTYSGTITGDAAHDGPGGAGGYVPGYVAQNTDGVLTYVFATADHVAVTGSGDVFAARLFSVDGALPVVLTANGGNGALELSAIRPQTGVLGTAIGVDVDHSSLVLQGDSRIYAQSDDAVPNSSSLAVRVVASTASFDGATDIETYTPGSSRALWVYQSTVNFNGPATILARARGEATTGVYTSGGGATRVNFNQGASVSALAIWPSDNVHGIYNDNVNTRIEITGDLDIAAVSQGSTAFGVRNQGVLNVSGDSIINVTGPRSTHGIANTHRTARINFAGDVAIHVVNQTNYTPFGSPTGVGNTYAGTASVRFDGDVSVGLSSVTEAFGINNAAMLLFSSADKRAVINATSSCSDCNVFGLHNYGGNLEVAGGLTVSTTSGNAAKAFSLWNVAADGRNASLAINPSGTQAVYLSGHVITGALPGETALASTRIALSTPGSFVQGAIRGYSNADGYYHAGHAELSVGTGTTWRHAGPSDQSDFGDGSLDVATFGVIDASAMTRTALHINDSSPGGASINLADRSILRVGTDVSGIDGAPAAGRVAMGSGVETFSATNRLVIGVARDPLLDSGFLTNADTNTAMLYPVSPALEVVDVSLAANGQASIPNIEARTESVPLTLDGIARTAAVTPILTLSTDQQHVLINGLRVVLWPKDTIFRHSMED